MTAHPPATDPHHTAPSEGGEDHPSPRSRSAWWALATLVVGVAAGVGIAAVVLDDGGAPPAPATADIAFDTDGAAPIDVTAGDGADTPVLPPGEATTPEQAVTSFLAAEVARDFEASWAYLADADRETAPTPAVWRAQHRQFPPISGFEVTGVDETTDEAVVTTSLALASSLDPVLGLVPARATADWVVEPAADGTWRVRYGAAELRSVLPDPAGAGDVAADWARAMVACRAPGALQGVDLLYGQVTLADGLCDADGPVQTGAVTTLPPTGGSSDLIASFGSDVVGWARVVPLTSPVELDIVLAPVDDEWVVIGVLLPQADR